MTDMIQVPVEELEGTALREAVIYACYMANHKRMTPEKLGIEAHTQLLRRDTKKRRQYVAAILGSHARVPRDLVEEPNQ